MKDSQNIDATEVREIADALIDALERDDLADASDILDTLSQVRESKLFRQVGKITRELHTSLSDFQVDERFSQLAVNEMPDARQRLEHVVEMTNKAADRTLNVVEDTLPLTEEMNKRSKSLLEEWDRFQGREMSLDEFRTLTKLIDTYLRWSVANADTIHKGMTEVMMAQDFQDLTGQILQKVGVLVSDVEKSLVTLISVADSSGAKAPGPSAAKEAKPEPTAHGPVVPGVDDREESTVSGQDDVDDLLNRLGF